MKKLFIVACLGLLVMSNAYCGTTTKTSNTTYIELEGLESDHETFKKLFELIYELLKDVTESSSVNYTDKETRCVLIETPSKTFTVCTKK